MGFIGYDAKSSFYRPLMVNILTEEEDIKNSQRTQSFCQSSSFSCEELEYHLAELTKLIFSYEGLL